VPDEPSDPKSVLSFRVDVDDLAATAEIVKLSKGKVTAANVKRLIYANGILRFRETGKLLDWEIVKRGAQEVARESPPATRGGRR